MPEPERIAVYEDLPGAQRMGFLMFQAQQWRAMGRGPLPPLTQHQGRVNAEVNHGRWIARCPNGGCRNAILASDKTPLFACDNCGAGWYAIIFPANKPDIERVLLRRPLQGGLAPTRNWLPREVVSDLERENAEHGIE